MKRELVTLPPNAKSDDPRERLEAFRVFAQQAKIIIEWEGEIYPLEEIIGVNALVADKNSACEDCGDVGETIFYLVCSKDRVFIVDFQTGCYVFAQGTTIYSFTHSEKEDLRDFLNFYYSRYTPFFDKYIFT